MRTAAVAAPAILIVCTMPSTGRGRCRSKKSHTFSVSRRSRPELSRMRLSSIDLGTAAIVSIRHPGPRRSASHRSAGAQGPRSEPSPRSTGRSTPPSSCRAPKPEDTTPGPPLAAGRYAFLTIVLACHRLIAVPVWRYTGNQPYCAQLSARQHRLPQQLRSYLDEAPHVVFAYENKLCDSEKSNGI